MRNLTQSTILAVICTLVLAGCRHNVTTAKAPQAPPAQVERPVANLSVNPATVERGQTAQLSWNTQNAATVTIDGIGPVDSTGSRTITPNETTTYHLSAKSSAGTAEATASVSVHAPVAKATHLQMKSCSRGTSKTFSSIMTRQKSMPMRSQCYPPTWIFWRSILR